MGMRIGGFARGAMLLCVSNFVVKLLGVLLKVPLANVCGAAALGYFNVAMSVFSFGLILVTAGLPTAVSRQCAQMRTAIGRRRVLAAALVPAAGVGLLSGAAVYAFAPQIADLMGCAGAAASVRVLSPGIPVCCIASVLRGASEGEGRMLPTALSQLAEALVRMSLGLFLALRLKSLHTEVVAAGVSLGALGGELAALAVLLPLFGRVRTGGRAPLRPLLTVAMPVTVGAFLHTGANLADNALVLRGLSATGLDAAESSAAFGVFSGYCLTVFSFPLTLTSALTTSLLPAAAARCADGSTQRVGPLCDRALYIAAVICAPLSAGLLAIPGPLLSLLFRREADVALAAPLLSALAPSMLFFAVASLSQATLTACGRQRQGVLCALAGCAVRLCMTALLVPLQGVGIMGAALSMLSGATVSAGLGLHALKRAGLYGGDTVRKLRLPCTLFFVVVMSALLVHPLLRRLLPPAAATLCCVAVCGMIYLIPMAFFHANSIKSFIYDMTKTVTLRRKCSDRPGDQKTVNCQKY